MSYDLIGLPLSLVEVREPWTDSLPPILRQDQDERREGLVIEIFGQPQTNRHKE